LIAFYVGPNLYNVWNDSISEASPAYSIYAGTDDKNLLYTAGVDQAGVHLRDGHAAKTAQVAHLIYSWAFSGDFGLSLEEYILETMSAKLRSPGEHQNV
jgi:hypothetical protein